MGGEQDGRQVQLAGEITIEVAGVAVDDFAGAVLAPLDAQLVQLGFDIGTHRRFLAGGVVNGGQRQELAGQSVSVDHQDTFFFRNNLHRYRYFKDTGRLVESQGGEYDENEMASDRFFLYLFFGKGIDRWWLCDYNKAYQTARFTRQAKINAITSP